MRTRYFCHLRRLRRGRPPCDDLHSPHASRALTLPFPPYPAHKVPHTKPICAVYQVRCIGADEQIAFKQTASGSQRLRPFFFCCNCYRFSGTSIKTLLSPSDQRYPRHQLARLLVFGGVETTCRVFQWSIRVCTNMDDRDTREAALDNFCH